MQDQILEETKQEPTKLEPRKLNRKEIRAQIFPSGHEGYPFSSPTRQYRNKARSRK